MGIFEILTWRSARCRPRLRKGLASAAAGNFRSNAQDGVPLPPELAGPRDLRFGIKEYLENGQLDEGTFCMIGKTGELLKAAAARGEEKLFIFDTSGFVASECQVSNVVKSSKKPIRDVARREASRLTSSNSMPRRFTPTSRSFSAVK